MASNSGEKSHKIKMMEEQLAKKLTRQVVGSLVGCVHCGMCNECCHYVLTHPDDPKMTPSYKADQLRKLFSLGTPHHGAPLERGGNRLDYLMELSPYVAPFTSLGKARSAGITDLRYGSITDVAHEFVPLPDDVECYALAATLGKRRSVLAERLVGDGLVPLNSALGKHTDSARTLEPPTERQWIGYEMGHLELLGRAEVYSQLHEWLRDAE